eukprot:c21428_g2_i2 orf=338-505(-)
MVVYIEVDMSSTQFRYPSSSLNPHHCSLPIPLLPLLVTEDALSITTFTPELQYDS